MGADRIIEPHRTDDQNPKFCLRIRPAIRRRQIWAAAALFARDQLKARFLAAFEIVFADEIRDARLNLGSPARSVEDAVMADAGLNIIRLQIIGQIETQIMRGLGLADA
jgi:hypothetical protein